MTDLARAFALYQAGNRDAAADEARRVLATEAHNASALNLLAVIALDANDGAAAEDYARRAIAAEGESAYLLNTLGNALVAQGRNAEGVDVLRRAVAADSNEPDLLFNLANALRTVAPAEAVATYRTVIALRPGNIGAYNNLAVLMKANGDVEGAATVLIEAVAHAPKSVALRFNLGNALQAAGRLDAAEAAYRRTIELQPAHAEAHANLGAVLLDLGRKTEAEAHFHRAVALNPDLTPAYVGLADLVDDGGMDAVAHRRAVLAIKPDLAPIRSSLLMCLHYTPEASREELFEEHRAYGAMFPLIPAAPRRARATQIHLGVVSGDFRFHAMLFFALPVFEARDRAAWHLTCYSATAKPDDNTAAFRAAADAWRDVRSLSATQLAELIARDGIDILIDLSGHAPHNRLPTFAHRPAPVQVAWGDYVDTRGLATIDVLLGDAIHTPPEDDRFYTERVVRFAPDYICYRPPAYAPPVAPSPDNGVVTFGCFSEVTKIGAASVAQWAAVLKAIPEARFLINNHLLADVARQERITRLFVEAGVGSERVVFRTGGPHAQFLAQYADVDVILDTTPYSGGLTTCEALLMGVPVLTVTGDRFCGRHATAHLRNGGYPEGVAGTVDELVEKARALAADRARRAALRAALRGRFLASTVCDVAGFANAFYSTLAAI